MSLRLIIFTRKRIIEVEFELQETIRQINDSQEKIVAEVNKVSKDMETIFGSSMQSAASADKAASAAKESAQIALKTFEILASQINNQEESLK